MRILTKKKLQEMLAESFDGGYENRKLEEVFLKFDKLEEVPIIITSLTLVKNPTYEIEQNLMDGIFSYGFAEYLVRFRLRSGIESEITLKLDNPDYSMSDISRMIEKEICGDLCGGEVGAN